MNLKPLFLLLVVPMLLAALGGCSGESPLRPAGGASMNTTSPSAGGATPVAQGGPPGYEPAYYNGQTYTINAIEMKNQKVPMQAQADFYEVVYPIGWENMGLQPPQCDPCDHEGNGIDFTDYHDHILDSIPGDPGGNNYKAPWHVYVIVPAYNHDPQHDAQVGAAYASYLPLKSEASIDQMLTQRLPDGSPVGIEVDTHFYFLCAVVGASAAR
jgi:hypothetical protein